MPRLFDAYVIAAWTAAETKKLGEQSLWLGVAKRDVRFRLYAETHNVATRAEGEALLASLLAEHARRGDRVLIGFDFALGWPQGTAARLDLKAAPAWSALWRFIADNIVDKADNTNNRYQVAAKMNRLMTDQAWPFWGAPAKQAQRWLTTTKPPEGAGDDIPDFRAVELALKDKGQTPRSLWQMHGAGAAGGPALIGVPAVRRLLDRLGASAAVWPFGTGWRALGEADVEPLSALVAEVRPELFGEARPETGEFKDQARVRHAALALADLDERGELATAFGPPKSAAEALIAAVESEEGWALGA